MGGHARADTSAAPAVWALAAVAAAALGGCTPLIGYVSDATSARDAAAEASALDADVVALDAGDEAAPPDGVAPSACFYAGTSCNPRTNAGCDAGQWCTLTSIGIFTLDAACFAPGPRALGASCDATMDALRCQSGLQCIQHRCLRLCCTEADDVECARAVPGSRCAAPSPNTVVVGCTLPGRCDYAVPTSCAAGETCEPSSFAGEATCVGGGTATVGAPCQRVDECAAGLVCTLAPPQTFGTCRRVCNRRMVSCVAPETCQSLAQNPLDFGTCRP